MLTGPCHGWLSPVFLLFMLQMLLGVGISVLGLLSLSSLLPSWAFMVLGSLSALGYFSSSLPGHSLALFFMSSALGSLIFFLGSPSASVFPRICGVGLLLSMGLPPFHFWSLSIISYLDITSLVFFLGPIKIGYLSIYISFSSGFFLFSLIPLVLGFLIFYTSNSLSFLLFASSSMQLIIYCFLRFSLFVFFYFIYLLCLSSVIFVEHKLIRPLLSFLSLAGLPPLGTFWSKALVVSVLQTHIATLVLVISGLLFYPYVSMAIHDSRRVRSHPMLVILLVTIPVLLFLGLTFFIVW